MKRFYNFSIEVISRLTKYAKERNPRLKKLVDGRKNLFENLEIFRQKVNQPIAWFHVASLGEYEQAKPVIAVFKKHFPTFSVVVSFFSPSGYEQIIKKPQENIDFITYLPFDTAANAALFIRILKPTLGFFVKYDLWANHILEAKKKQTPLFLFSASLRSDQIYFRPYGGFFKKVIKSFDHIFVQNQKTVDLLSEIGFNSVSISGDTRFDRVKQISDNPMPLPEVGAFAEGKDIMVIGSAWPEDMELIIPFINQHSHYKYIIAPHDIDDHLMEDWENSIHKKCVRFSAWQDDNEAEVLYIDNIGMLSSLYQFARLAYVGGAFGKGLHNILEPLAYGIPVIFGKIRKPNKFPEAAISSQYGCGFSVKDQNELLVTIAELENAEKYQESCMAAKKLVNENIGSAEKIIQSIKKQINAV